MANKKYTSINIYFGSRDEAQEALSIIKLAARKAHLTLSEFLIHAGLQKAKTQDELPH